MVCETEVQKGEKLVSIPRKLWMTSDTAKKSAICGKLVTEEDIESWQARCHGANLLDLVMRNGMQHVAAVHTASPSPHLGATIHTSPVECACLLAEYGNAATTSSSTCTQLALCWLGWFRKANSKWPRRVIISCTSRQSAWQHAWTS